MVVGLHFQQHLGDGLKLHVGCALVDLTDLGVAVKFFDGIFFGETIASKNVNSRGTNPFSHFAGK